MKEFLKKDNYVFGALLGIFVPVVFYGILYLTEMLLKNAGIWNGIKPHHNIYLLSLFTNIVLFRTYFIKLKADKTGRGLLLITIVLILLFFYLFFQNPQ